jgi:hypothetical protein
LTREEYDREGRFQLKFMSLGMPIISYLALAYSVLFGEQSQSRAYEQWQRDPIEALIMWTVAIAIVTFFFGPVCYWLREPYWLYQQLPDRT